MITNKIFTITGIIGLILITLSTRLFNDLITIIVSVVVIGTLIFMRISKSKDKKD